MAIKLIVSAGSTEQREAIGKAIASALAEHGMRLTEPDARPPETRGMFPSGEVVHYTLEALEAIGTTVVGIGAGVVANAIYARLKFLHPKDEIEKDPIGSGFEVVNHTPGARVEIDDGSDDDGA